MPDVSSRLLRYFIAVAEELHITQAAARLYVAQPALSKAIRRLERDVGYPLFDRDRHGVRLTDAGAAFLPAARRVLAELDAGLGAAGVAHRAGQRVLRIGYHSSLGTGWQQAIAGRFAERRPGWRLELRVADWSDPARGLLDGAADAALLRLPVPGQDGLDTVRLRSDRRWVALPAGHRLAARDAVRLADLRDEVFVALPVTAGVLRESWLARGAADPPRTIGAEVSNADDFFEAISSGAGIAMLTETSTRVHQRPGIVYRPVTDGEPSDLVVAWRRGDTDPVLRDFVAACTAAATTVA